MAEDRARSEIVEGLAQRALGLLRALDRRDRLETAARFVGWLGTERREGALATTTREVLLRALRTAGDPLNLQILEHLDPLDACDLGELMDATGLARVAMSERVNDLVQSGLAAREMVGDQVRGTPLAHGLVSLIADLSQAAAESLEPRLGPAPEES